MSAFVDTSAILAVLDRDDKHHEPAARIWRQLIELQQTLHTTNYVVVECDALVRRRLGMETVRALHDDLLPVINIEWVSEDVHFAAVGASLLAGRGGPSLVDCVSFEAMRRQGLQRVFTFDRHFALLGFECLPA